MQKISKKSFYLRTLWIPAIAPVLSGLLFFVPYVKHVASVVTAVTLSALVAGGIQYVLFIFVIYQWRLKDMTGDEVQRASWITPLLYLPFGAMLFLLYIMWGNTTGYGKVNSFGDALLLTLGAFGAIGLPLSYVYVLTAHGLYKLFVRCGIVEKA